MRILQRSVIHFLVEGKLENLQTKYPDHADEIKELSERDPSSTKKYLDYAVKVLISGKALAQEIGDVIVLFHKFQNKFDFDKRDIGKWKNFTELRDQLFELEQSGEKSKTAQKREMKAGGADKLYEDEQVVMYFIKTKDASMTYGAGTKWCVTMRDKNYFQDYNGRNIILIFLLRKDLTKENPNYKVALVFQRDLKNKIIEKQYFNAPDTGFEKPTPLKDVKNLEQVLSIAENTAKNAPKSTWAKLLNGEIKYSEIPESERTSDVVQYTLLDEDSREEEVSIEEIDRLLKDLDEKVVNEGGRQGEIYSCIVDKKYIPDDVKMSWALKYDGMLESVFVATKLKFPFEIAQKAIKLIEKFHESAESPGWKYVIENHINDDYFDELVAGSIQLQGAVILNTNRRLSIDTLREFVKHDQPDKVLKKLLESDWITSDILKQLIDSSDTMKRALLLYTDVPLQFDVLERLVASGNESAIKAIFEKKWIPKEVIDQLFAKSFEMQKIGFLSYKRPVSVKVLEQLLFESDKEDHRKYHAITHAIATQDWIPDEVLQQLMAKSKELQEDVLSYTEKPISIEVLHSLVEKYTSHDMKWNLERIVSRDWITDEVLMDLCQNSSKLLNTVVSSNNRHVSQELIEKYFNDPDKRVYVASRSDLPIEMLQKLVFDTDPKVRYEVAENESLTPQQFITLINDEDPKVRQSVARNKKIPQFVFQKLMSDKNTDVLYWLALNPTASPNDLIQLSKNKNAGIRSAVFRNPNTPESVMRRFEQED